jgi:prevent-host-death family protein
MNKHMNVWSLQEAKARLSQLVRLAQTEGPQTVTLHGKPVVTVRKVDAEGVIQPGMTGDDLLRLYDTGKRVDFEPPSRESDQEIRDVDLP